MTREEEVLDLGKRWYERPLPLRVCSLKEVANDTTTKEEMDAMFSEARDILNQATNRGHSDKGRWYNTQFISRGTTSDKIASAAVKLSDTDFMFFLEGFNLLFDTARTDTHHYEAALKALAVIWTKLMPRRPLKRFFSQFFATLPANPADRKVVLVYWYLEDYLKRTYAQFLSLAEAMLKDRLQQRREAWLDVVGKLICNVAESRHVAMALMVDKLGDPAARVAHNAYHHLLALLRDSSIHQGVLFVELEKVIFMKNCPKSTMKYATNVMNQFVYNKDERKLALKAIQTYLSIFRQLAISGSVDLSVTTATIVGLRRAFPYAGTDVASLEEHLNALFVIANTGNFTQRVTTMSLLQLVALGKSATEEFRNRWYRALYKLLLISPKQVSHSAHITGFFSMLHKAVRLDTNDDRIAAFIHRLLQRALFFHESMICAILLLVGDVLQAHPRLRSVILGSRRPPVVPAEERYDVKHREPQYARAKNECLYTLGVLARHSHSSVVQLAVMLLFGEEIIFDSHPLDELTLINFLQMFVDAKAHTQHGIDSDVAAAEAVGKAGSSVFRRATHRANLPSASDPFFINSSVQQVDVSALFLHRYAVQRQRFIDGLSRVRSTWGDASGEADVALRVSDVDASLFGPSGVLGDPAVSKKKNKRAKKKKERLKEKLKEGAVLDECVEAIGSEEVEGGEDNFFDMEGSEGDLEWGSGDEGVMMDDDEDGDDGNERDDDGVGLALSRRENADVDDGEDLAEMLEAHRNVASKKRRREEAWLERVTSAAGTKGPNRRSFVSRRR